MMGPYIRIALRYGVGGVVGYHVGDMLASDPDVIAVATAGAAAVIGAGTEMAYAFARRMGWKT